MRLRRGAREFLLDPEIFVSPSVLHGIDPGYLEPSVSEQAQRKPLVTGVGTWQVSDVLLWLETVCPSHAEYSDAFRAERINGIALVSLDKSELHELVANVGDRARIWHGIVALRRSLRSKRDWRNSQMQTGPQSRQQLRLKFSDGRETVLNVDDCTSAAKIMQKALRYVLPAAADHEAASQWAFVREPAAKRRLTDEEVMELARKGDLSTPLKIVSASSVSSRPPAPAPPQRKQRPPAVQTDSSSSIATVTAEFHDQSQSKTAQPLTAPLTQVSGLAGRRNARRASLMSVASNASVASSERPTSQYVSMNLHEYFPDADKRELADTVRRSVLLQRRLSLYEEGNRLSRRASNLISPLNTLVDIKREPSHSEHAFPQPQERNASLDVPPYRQQRASRAPSQQLSQKQLEDKLRELKLLPEVNHEQRNSSHAESSSDTLRALPDQLTLPKEQPRPPRPLPRSQTAYGNVPSLTSDRPQTVRSASADDAAQISEPDFHHINQQLDELVKLENQNVPPSRWIRGRLIGSGSFGTVYMGINLLTGELMAVKQVEIPADSKKQHQRKMVETLRHEISLMQNLDHENIVQYRGFESDNNHINIFLEYVPGGSLASLIAQYGAFEESLARHYARQTLVGLAYLHEQDIIHRDIKGANVLVNDRGLIKISDFGLSKKVETQQLLAKGGPQRQSMQGSAFWMAPEIVNGKETTTPKADIWSFGCLLIELVTGTHPFPSLTQMQAIFKVGNMQRPAFPENASPQLRDFLEKSLEIRKDLRPGASELLSHPFLANT